MIFFFLHFINGKLLTFNNTVVKKGFQIQRSIDSIGLSFISNISISNCSKNDDCKLDIIYYRNNDTSLIFTNKYQNGLFNICCSYKDAKENSCNLNSINLPKNSPFTHVEYSQSNSMKSVTVPLITDGIWSVLITSCVDNETTFILNGCINYKPILTTYVDERIKKISLFCLQSCISSVVFLIFYAVAQNKFNSQITVIQSSFCSLIFFSSISDLFIYLFFDFYNKYYHCLLYFLYFSATFRSLSRTLLFKITYDGLQFPNLISVFIVAPLFFIFTVSFYHEFNGIHEITSRITGSWLFGYGNPITSISMFLSNIFITVYIYYCAKTAKNITDTEKRSKSINFISINLIVYVIFTFVIVLIRKNSSLYFSRKLELITFCIEPFHFFVLVLINSWFLFIFNPQGWEQITSNQNENFDQGIGAAINDSNDKPSLVGNAYALPSTMLNAKTEFALDIIEEEEENENNTI